MNNKLISYVKKGSFYQAVVEDGSDIIFIVDYAGKILYHNRSVKETLGYRSNALVGKSFFDFIFPSTLPAFKKAYAASTKKRYNESVEFQFRCKDGTFRYLEFNSINLLQKEKMKGMILDCRDIEQRKKDADELLHAQKAKELFLANISHEIRTPINGIAGMASLLRQNPNASEHALYLQAIQSAADNLKVIINDILDLTSIESGKLKFEQIGFNLNDLLKSLIDTFSFQASEKGIRLHYELQPEVNRIFIGDPVRLNQILLNLIGNAIKFTQQGSISLSCRLLQQKNKKYILSFEVADSGIGIPQGKLSTIFESFSQADASITRKYGGTGLGLTIVKQLTELQKGHISVKSKEGVGSVFTVNIPYLLANEHHLPHTNKPTVLQKKNLSHLSVLLAEDNDINQLYASSILKTWKCKIELAENGLVAVEKIKSRDYDVVLMDVQMPVMDGLEATKVIRGSMPPKNQIPIIALTANASPKDIEECRQAGMNDWVAKPFTPDDLYHKLSSIKGSIPAQKAYSKINLSHLEKVSNNDEKFIREIAQAILQTFPDAVIQIQKAATAGDWISLGEIVHKIKPSITMIGMKDAKEKAIHIEELVKSGHSAPLRLLADELCADLSDATQELQEIYLRQ
ncbi:MAG: response regulator [Bacteroidetes bacterium]|nr:response regulator [Bacteroidota bacterium]MBS1541481.1 response regulator [Bacteroidota bacterium]